MKMKQERSEELSIMATTDTPSGEDAMDSSSIPAWGSADISVAPDTVNLLNPPPTDMKPTLKPTTVVKKRDSESAFKPGEKDREENK